MIKREVLFIGIISVFLLFGCRNNRAKEVTLDSGLRYEILKEGAGAQAMQGDEVIIHETMGYLDGSVLYSTEGKGVNLPKFVLGRNEVIEGVEQGVTGMRVGEVRKLIVPTSLSKREVYPKFISPDSTLVYTIKLVTINKAN